MDERRALILTELKNQCKEKQLYEFEYYWEIWGVMWYPWFIEFPDRSNIKFTANDISLEDLYYFAEIGELIVLKKYESQELSDECERVQFQLINK